MSDATILREYLVSLGFKVDAAGAKKIDETLKKTDKSADQLAKNLFKVGTAVTAMVTVFTYQMEKLYYASRRSDSTAAGLQNMAYGAGQIGISGDKMKGSIEALARSLRSNPGLTGLLNSLGVKVEGRDRSDVLMDMVTQLKKMPFPIAERMGNLFGIDSDTLYMMMKGLDEMKQAVELRKQMAAEVGVNPDEVAKAGQVLAQAWRTTTEQAGLLKDTLMITVLPILLQVAKVTQEILKDWTYIFKAPGEAWQRFKEGLGGDTLGGGVKLTPEAEERAGRNSGEGLPWYKKTIPEWASGISERFIDWGGGKRKKQREAKSEELNSLIDNGLPVDESKPTAESLESKYRLPDGTLRPGVKTVEPQYGVDKHGNRISAKEAMRSRPEDTDMAGMYADALNDAQEKLKAAKTAEERHRAEQDIQDILREAKGKGVGLSSGFASQATSAGQQMSADQLRLTPTGSTPSGTATQAGAVINQSNTVTISGVSDPQKAAKEVDRAHAANNADLVRNFTPRVV